MLVPSVEDYKTIYLHSKIGASSSARCMAQCTGCRCSCSVVAHVWPIDFPLEPKSEEYARISGNIVLENTGMARCACVSCNSCTCACSCRRAETSISF